MKFGRSDHLSDVVSSIASGAEPKAVAADQSLLNQELLTVLQSTPTAVEDLCQTRVVNDSQIAFLPLDRLVSDPEILRIEAQFRDVLKSGKFTSGSKVSEVEKELGDFLHGTVIGASSGTEALMAALTAVGVGPGSRVVVPANSFAATENAILALGADPVLCDVDPESFCLDPGHFEVLAPSGIACVVPVHLYGRRPDLSSIRRIADQHGIKVVDDACQSFGLDNLGQDAHATALSFNPYKNLGACGKAGAVLTTSESIAASCQEFLYHGFAPGVKNLKTRRYGLNARLDNLQAAALLARMPYVTKNNLTRSALAHRYDEGLRPLAEAGKLVLPTWDGEIVWHLYTVRVDRRMRDTVHDRLKTQHGIETDVYYPRSTHRQPSASTVLGPGNAEIELPHTDTTDEEIMQLPLYPDLTVREQDRIIDALSDVLAR